MELATGQGYQALRYREDMATPRRLGTALIALMLCIGGMSATPAPGAPGARAAPPELVKELRPVIEHARQRFEARDATGVLAHVSEQYRSGGLTKADLRQQILAMFSLYEVLRARLTIDDVQFVDGAVWVYTSGEVSGRLPLVGWVTVLTWRNEPEVARREDVGWRLFGFQT
jgi:hypothetical protein